MTSQQMIDTLARLLRAAFYGRGEQPTKWEIECIVADYRAEGMTDGEIAQAFHDARRG